MTVRRFLSRLAASLAALLAAVVLMPTSSASAGLAATRTGLVWASTSYSGGPGFESAYRSPTHLTGPMHLYSGDYLMDVTADSAYCTGADYRSCLPQTRRVAVTGTARSIKATNPTVVAASLPVGGSCLVPIGPSDTGWMDCLISVGTQGESPVHLTMGGLNGTLIFCIASYDSCVFGTGDVYPLNYDDTYIQHG